MPGAQILNFWAPTSLGRLDQVRSFVATRLALNPPRNTDPNGAPLFSIDVAQHLGHETLLDASSGPHRVVARVSASDDSHIGERRPFHFDPDHMHLFDPDTGANLFASEPERMTSPSSIGI